ncbi:hypothetical protein AbraIFM66950_005709 [Aspergillus brasiliensis]|nr:hypothetical protein AbraIFM66950_005709 [Aspergillus brasiliensis]
MSSSQVASHQPDDTPPNERSRYRMIKEAGFNNMHDFMLSHGLKPRSLEDYGEANQILDTMRQSLTRIKKQDIGEAGPEYQAYREAEPNIQESEHREGRSTPFFHDQYEDYEADQSYPDYEDCEADTGEPDEEGYDYSDSGMNDSCCDGYYD